MTHLNEVKWCTKICADISCALFTGRHLVDDLSLIFWLELLQIQFVN